MGHRFRPSILHAAVDGRAYRADVWANVRQLEASMLELYQVFLDMSILVTDHSAHIDSIERWVRSLWILGLRYVSNAVSR